MLVSKVTFPVKFGAARFAFAARLVVIVEEKAASSASAAANSFNVFRVPGAPSTKLEIAVVT